MSLGTNSLFSTTGGLKKKSAASGGDKAGREKDIEDLSQRENDTKGPRRECNKNTNEKVP